MVNRLLIVRFGSFIFGSVPFFGILLAVHEIIIFCSSLFRGSLAILEVPIFSALALSLGTLGGALVLASGGFFVGRPPCCGIGGVRYGSRG